MTAPAGLVALTAVQPDPYGFKLDSSLKMHDALNYLLDRGYTGLVEGLIVGGVKTWRLLINSSESSTHQAANINDWIAVDRLVPAGTPAVAHVVTAAEVAAGQRFTLRA